ncbi:MAG: hypothetical protein U0U66_03740 [Cytophagaceae bacterium]
MENLVRKIGLVKYDLLTIKNQIKPKSNDINKSLVDYVTKDDDKEYPLQPVLKHSYFNKSRIVEIVLKGSLYSEIRNILYYQLVVVSHKTKIEYIDLCNIYLDSIKYYLIEFSKRESQKSFIEKSYQEDINKLNNAFMILCKLLDDTENILEPIKNEYFNRIGYNTIDITQSHIIRAQNNNIEIATENFEENTNKSILNSAKDNLVEKIEDFDEKNVNLQLIKAIQEFVVVTRHSFPVKKTKLFLIKEISILFGIPDKIEFNNKIEASNYGNVDRKDPKNMVLSKCIKNYKED